MKLLRLQGSGVDTQEQGKARSRFLLRLALSLFAGVFAIFLSAPSSAAAASNIYISQNGGGTGTSCSSASSAAWFNNSGNWGSGSAQIGPGTIVHLCGTFTGTAGTTMMTAQGSGSSGSPITILFESGAILQAPYWNTGGAINTNGQSYITIDGGTNGKIQNTLSGTAGASCIGGPCSDQQYSSGITAMSCNNCEIKNLTIADIYLHTSTSDTSVDQTMTNCIKFSGSNVLIHDNVMHDTGWCLNELYANGDANVSIYNNNIYNIDHGWILATTHSGGSSGPFSFYSNHVHDYANWDTATDSYHHDGIHCYTAETGGSAAHITSLNIYDNLFDGTLGSNATADIFLEGGTGSGSTPCMDGTSLGYEYNNVLIGDQPVNNGLIGNFAGNMSVYNNTFIGSGTSAGVCYGSNSDISVEKFENNVLTGCNQLINLSGIPSLTINSNVYGNGGNNAFVCNSNFYNASQLSAWQSCIGGDSNSLYSLLGAALGSLGILQTASPAVGAGINLTSLGITALDSDTTAGDSRTPVARPSNGAWAAGAYQSGTVANQPAPPSGLIATVE